MMYVHAVTPALLSRIFAPKALSLRALGLACALAGGVTTLASPLVAQADAPKAQTAPKVDRNAIGQAALNDFQKKHRAVEALVAKGAKDAALSAQVDSLLNYKALAQAALGPNPTAVCKTQCDAFEQALTELIRKNYLRFLRKSKQGRVEYLGAQVGRKGTAVKLKTIVHPKKAKGKAASRKQVKVSYILQRSGSEWQVVDIITEGVSLRKTYRYEFQKIIERPAPKGGIEGVIAKIRSKLAELSAKP